MNLFTKPKEPAEPATPDRRIYLYTLPVAYEMIEAVCHRYAAGSISFKEMIESVNYIIDPQGRPRAELGNEAKGQTL